MNIKNLRAQTRMTQKEFAEYFNIPPRTIENWEGDKRNPPEYVVELIKYKIEKERLGMLRLVEMDHGDSKVLIEGTLLEIIQYLQGNEDLYTWVNDDVDPMTGPIELPILDDIETVRELQQELSKVDLGWWALEIEEA